nr:hypothetical protein Iba_chr02aCG4480 [Ipomoea batatas]
MASASQSHCNIQLFHLHEPLNFVHRYTSYIAKQFLNPCPVICPSHETCHPWKTLDLAKYQENYGDPFQDWHKAAAVCEQSPET